MFRSNNHLCKHTFKTTIHMNIDLFNDYGKCLGAFSGIIRNWVLVFENVRTMIENINNLLQMLQKLKTKFTQRHRSANMCVNMWHIVKAAAVVAIQQQRKQHTNVQENQEKTDRQIHIQTLNYCTLHSIEWHSSLYCSSYMVFSIVLETLHQNSISNLRTSYSPKT